MTKSDEVTMKERSILFNGVMVRASLDGSKTKTLWVVKPTRWTPTIHMPKLANRMQPAIPIWYFPEQLTVMAAAIQHVFPR